MSYYDAMREVMDNSIEHDICNLYFYHVMMGLINKAESEHKFLYDEFMNAKGDRIKAENAKLRELADAVKEFVEDTHCEDCPCRRECDDNNHVFCNDFSYHAFAAMRELVIEG